MILISHVVYFFDLRKVFDTADDQSKLSCYGMKGISNKLLESF